MKTKTFLLLIISLSFINLRAQETPSPKYFEIVKRPLTNKYEPLLFFNDTIIRNVNQIGKLDKSNIHKIIVVKNNLDSLTKIYGTEAQNGLIFIYSKEFVAKKWLKEFSLKNNAISKIVEDTTFSYKDYLVYLNGELLKTDFFDGLDEKLKSQKILDVEIKRYKSDSEKGIFCIKTKIDD